MIMRSRRKCVTNKSALFTSSSKSSKLLLPFNSRSFGKKEDIVRYRYYLIITKLHHYQQAQYRSEFFREICEKV